MIKYPSLLSFACAILDAAMKKTALEHFEYTIKSKYYFHATGNIPIVWTVDRIFVEQNSPKTTSI